MAGKCYSCGEVGHPSFLCPKVGKGQPAGRGGKVGKGGYGGKGNYGGKGGYGGWGGKGGGKGEWGGKEFAEKGLGKGYRWACFNCGKKGHKAFECRGPARTAATNMVEQEPAKEVECNGIVALMQRRMEIIFLEW